MGKNSGEHRIGNVLPEAKCEGKVTDMKKFFLKLVALGIGLTLLGGCAAPTTAASIVDAKIDENGNLILFMSSGTTINAGEVRGEDGVSVEGAIVDGEGNLQIALSDDSSVNAGYVRGQDGQDGRDGRDGRDGEDGEDGKDGRDGRNGLNGLDGRDGVDGQDGEDGRDGQDGKDGEDGRDGIDGQDGKDGEDGKDGQDGKDGEDGEDGRDGIDGVDGEDGLTPYIGPNGNWWIGDKDTGAKADQLFPSWTEDQFSFGIVQPDGLLKRAPTCYLEDDAFVVEYDYTEIDPVYVGGSSGEYTQMGLLILSEIDDLLGGMVDYIDEIWVDGRNLATQYEGAAFERYVEQNPQTCKDEGIVYIPFELIKAGYSDSIVLEFKGHTDNEDFVINPGTHIHVKLINTQNYKETYDAEVVNIESCTEDADVYAVGPKLYFDLYNPNLTEIPVRVTFASEQQNFSDVVTWVYNEDVFTCVGEDEEGAKLYNSYAELLFRTDALWDNQRVVFHLETEKAKYETNEHPIIIRDLSEADPKGIYFAETIKTIAIGEEYTPVVMGVATGESVDATIDIGNSNPILDTIDGRTIIGTQEGVAYITAVYDYIGGKSYKTSSMKIVVKAPEPEEVATGYIALSDPSSSVNVRSGPSTSSSKLGSLKHGDMVKIFSQSGDWYKIQFGGGFGYIMSSYVSGVTFYTT